MKKNVQRVESDDDKIFITQHFGPLNVPKSSPILALCTFFFKSMGLFDMVSLIIYNSKKSKSNDRLINNFQRYLIIGSKWGKLAKSKLSEANFPPIIKYL